MKRIHIALSTHNISESIKDYSIRLGMAPCVIIENEYALWRTDTVNLSIRNDPKVSPGNLRHLGWESSNAIEFTTSKDVNGILWEEFNAEQQKTEIEEVWPTVEYKPRTKGV